MIVDNSIKQVIVVRKDLKMRKGKIAAQAAHASNNIFTQNYHVDSKNVIGGSFLVCHVSNLFIKWMESGATKVVVSVDSEEELDELYNKIMESKHKGDIPCEIVIDAGLTEFGGVETKTCMAIGPYHTEIIDEYTSHLKLL